MTPVATSIQFGNGLAVTDLGSGTIRVDGGGAVGPAGPGVPAGGTTGQALVKTSSTDYATNWQTMVSLPADTVVVAATRIIANKLLAVDAQPAFQFNGDGRHLWGPGGSTATDTTLYRSAAGVLQTDGQFRSQPSAVQASFTGLVVGDTTPRSRISTDGKIEWGPGNAALDTNLYRGGAGLLQTDGTVNIKDPNTASGGLTVIHPSVTTAAWILSGYVTGEAANRFRIRQDGACFWGPGNTASDINLYRYAANWIGISGSLVVNAAQATQMTLQPVLSTNPGVIFGNAQDAAIYRPAANQLTIGLGPSSNNTSLHIGGGSRGANQANEYTLAIRTSNISVVPNTGSAYGVLYVGADNRLYYVDPTGAQRAIG